MVRRIMDDLNAPQVKIERPLYDHQQLREDYEYQIYKPNYLKKFVGSCQSCQPVDALKRSIPVLEWLPKYKWRSDLTSDLISGFTIAILQIAQGMAYGLLGNVSPVVGIYMAFFPNLVYFLFGDSKHISMGTFSIVCLMTGKIVIEHSDPSYMASRDLPLDSVDPSNPGYSPIEVACAVTFVVALLQILMYIFRLGIVTSLLSETLVSAFTTGSAFHVFVAMLKDASGIKGPKQRGYFEIYYAIKNIIDNFVNINYATVTVTVIVILVSLINEFFKPKVAKRCSLPIPMELIAIILGAVASYTMNLHDVYGIKIVGHIPEGIPMPVLPRFSLIQAIWIDCIMIAIVSYTISLSLGLIYAQKYNYEVDANQELLAQGMGNLIGSFFSCMPFTASLSRSSVQVAVGGKTQLVSVVSSGILLVVLMWIGPYFEPLPKCVLAGVIIVALKGMLMKVTDFCKFWSLSKLDGLVWLVTFFSVVFVATDIGLLVGVVMSLAYIFLLGLRPYTCLLGWVPNTDLYLDTKRYKGVKELSGIKIFHYQGSINFASKNFFKAELFKVLNLYPQTELAIRNKVEKLKLKMEKVEDERTTNKIKSKLKKLTNKSNVDMKCLILDFSALSYIDPSGVTMLKLLSQEFERIEIPVYIAGCSEPVYETMSKCDLFNDKSMIYKIFPTVHDAVQFGSSTFQGSSDTLVSTIRL
ncbi:PREDICTED: solute carrier family 26 member 6-like [Nicrophorus vespilloides]|uniref:Solute carrier family 26 member 6-like n=1 Tax=Nicrophorus vespilloides TaxID=110193 RepID=A0ABM1MYD3_NICVS|nr:PREDICTED: solute carrier family 26 member 6-like [Nicrophorus vespilloides]